MVIPPRTLKHRRQRQEPLNLDESDRLARVARIYELAVKVYGDRETDGSGRAARRAASTTGLHW